MRQMLSPALRQYLSHATGLTNAVHVHLQTKRKGFNAAEARVADTGAAQFFDARKGVPKADAALLNPSHTSRKTGRYSFVHTPGQTAKCTQRKSQT